jgi:hypothetical protein
VAEAFSKAEGFEIAAADLPRRLVHAAEAARRPQRADEPIVMAEFLTGIERELIERALKQAKGNKARAARLLGLTRPRLYRRMVQLGLEQVPSLPLVGDPRLRHRPTKGQRRLKRPEPADIDGATAAINEEAEFIEDIPFEEQPD